MQAGVSLDAGQILNVTVNVVDASILDSNAVTVDFSLTIIGNPVTELLINQNNFELILSSNELIVLEVLQDLITNDLITDKITQMP